MDKHAEVLSPRIIHSPGSGRAHIFRGRPTSPLNASTPCYVSSSFPHPPDPNLCIYSFSSVSSKPRKSLRIFLPIHSSHQSPPRIDRSCGVTPTLKRKLRTINTIVAPSRRNNLASTEESVQRIHSGSRSASREATSETMGKVSRAKRRHFGVNVLAERCKESPVGERSLRLHGSETRNRGKSSESVDQPLILREIVKRYKEILSRKEARRAVVGTKEVAIIPLSTIMIGPGAHKSSQSSPANRFIYILSTTSSQHHHRGSTDPRKTYTSASKLRIIPAQPFGARIHSRPQVSPTPSLQQHFQQLRSNPSLSGLFRDNVHVKRLSTPNPIRKRQPLAMKKAIVNWVTNKKRALLTSVLASSDTLYGFLDKELNLSMQDMERPSPSLQHSPLNPIPLKVNQSTESLMLEKKKSKLKTDRKERKSVQTLPSRPLSRVALEKLPFKEACRDRDWVTRAKEQLSRDWAKALRLSNGVQLEPASEGYSAYTYFLGKGNNHPLVKACFKGRGWIRVTDEDAEEAVNLVWTQSKVKWLFKTYPEAVCAHPQIIVKPVTVSCTVKLLPKNSIDNKGRSVETKSLGYDLVTQSLSFIQLSASLLVTSQKLRTHNKLEHNYHLTNKKTLFMSIKTYCNVLGANAFEVIPLTFHIKDGTNDSEFHRFLEVFNSIKLPPDDFPEEVKSLRNIWIIKPGENTNRGTGITVCNTLDQIKAEITSYAVCSVTGLKRTFILQKYIENPLLINKRKFDIRCFAMMTSINGVQQGYYYQEGYLRTSCKEFSLKDVGNRYIHLTNDAVQKHSEDYGKFEAGNKLSYSDFQRYLDGHYANNTTSVQKDIVPQIRTIIKTTFMATFAKLDAMKRQYSFEILGYDFMVDANMKVWLIEVNTNPCLELSSPLLARVIPAMLDNAMRIAVDPYYPEGGGSRRPATSLTGEMIPENKFELIFSSLVDGVALKSQLGERFSLLETFDPALQDMPDDDDVEEEDEQSDDGC